MNLRRIIGTLIVLLATIVGRWIARDPATSRASKRSIERDESSNVATRVDPVLEPVAAPLAPPAAASTRLVPEPAPVANEDVAFVPETPAAREPALDEERSTASDRPAVAVAEPSEPERSAESLRPSDFIRAAEPRRPDAVERASESADESLVSAPAPVAHDEPTREPALDDRTPESPVARPVVREADPEPPAATYAASAAETAFTRPRAWSRDWPIAVPARGAATSALGGGSTVATIEPAGADATMGPRDESEAASAFEPVIATRRPISMRDFPEPSAVRSTEPSVVAPPNALETVAPPARANGDADDTPADVFGRDAGVAANSRGFSSDEDAIYRSAAAPPRSRRRSESVERPNRLLGGAGFLIVAIACFLASFLLFVRLTTPDRSPASVYTVVPYVAATERNVPPALASFAGNLDAGGDLWLVLRLPVAARYVAMTGLRTVERWTSYDTFSLVGVRTTLPPNAASCYSGAGVASGPPQLTPLPPGLVVRQATTSSLTPERLVRVDVGALLADATGMKTLVCAIVAPARTSYAAYSATIGAPNVAASEVTGSQVRLSVLPLAVDFSTFGNAAAMRFTQTSLAVATDPLHATLDVAGFATFAFDDADGDARRDVLLFLTGALATLGAVATIDALRPWLGIERR